jgi:hypothetical protein
VVAADRAGRKARGRGEPVAFAGTARRSPSSPRCPIRRIRGPLARPSSRRRWTRDRRCDAPRDVQSPRGRRARRICPFSSSASSRPARTCSFCATILARSDVRLRLRTCRIPRRCPTTTCRSSTASADGVVTAMSGARIPGAGGAHLPKFASRLSVPFLDLTPLASCARPAAGERLYWDYVPSLVGREAIASRRRALTRGRAAAPAQIERNGAADGGPAARGAFAPAHRPLRAVSSAA